MNFCHSPYSLGINSLHPLTASPERWGIILVQFRNIFHPPPVETRTVQDTSGDMDYTNPLFFFTPQIHRRLGRPSEIFLIAPPGPHPPPLLSCFHRFSFPWYLFYFHSIQSWKTNTQPKRQAPTVPPLHQVYYQCLFKYVWLMVQNSTTQIPVDLITPFHKSTPKRPMASPLRWFLITQNFRLILATHS